MLLRLRVMGRFHAVGSFLFFAVGLGDLLGRIQTVLRLVEVVFEHFFGCVAVVSDKRR